MDTITFSNDSLNNIEYLIESIWYVTKRQFLSFKMTEKLKENNFEHVPSWFQRNKLFNFMEWIAAHLEVNIQYHY
jgi:hypothetical protein